MPCQCPVISWRERDKLSSAWPPTLPSPPPSLWRPLPPSSAFPVLLVSPGWGRGRRARVGRFGDEVSNATMRGDGPCQLHDAMKLMIQRLLVWAVIPVECQVFNQFADCIPQAGLARIERGRHRQGLVPDFKLRGRGGEGYQLC